MEGQESKVKKTGTTTLGIICDDGVIIASEMRGTAGYIISDEMQKIFEIDKHIGMAGAGVGGDILALVRILRIEAKLYRTRQNKHISVEAAANLLSNIMYQYKMIPFITAVIFGGVETNGRTKLFTLDPYGAIDEVREHSAFGGSGWPAAQAVLDSSYEKGSIRDLIPLAVKAIKMAIKRDPNSGGKVDIVTITKGEFRRYKQEEIEKLTEKEKRKK